MKVILRGFYLAVVVDIVLFVGILAFLYVYVQLRITEGFLFEMERCRLEYLPLLRVGAVCGAPQLFARLEMPNLLRVLSTHLLHWFPVGSGEWIGLGSARARIRGQMLLAAFQSSTSGCYLPSAMHLDLG